MSNIDSKDPELPKPEQESVDAMPAESANNGLLDLGLGNLLSSHAASEADSAKASDTQADLIQTIQEQALQADPGQALENIEPPLSELEQLEKDSNWTQILQNTEAVLEVQSSRQQSSDKWIEAQAWWIIAQLNINSLPAAVLCAPMEAVIEHVISSHSSNAAAFKDSKTQNTDQDHSKIIALVEKSAALLAARFFSQNEMLAGMQLLSRARVLGGNLSALRQVVEQYSAVLNTLEGNDQRLFAILQKELGFSARDFAKIAVDTNDKTATDFATENYTKKTSYAFGIKKQKSFFVYVIIIFIILLLILIALLVSMQGPKILKEFPYQSKELDLNSPALQIPKPEPVAKVSELDAVLYGLGGKGQTVQNPSNNNSIEVQPPATPELRTPKPKVLLDTQGPLESEQLRDLREKGNQQKTAERRQPEILVPGPAIAPRFETFPNTRVYKIRKATNLMLKPSLNSDAVAGLSRGDRVNVVGMAGYWLKVLSRQGKIAYVLAEDAELE